MGLRLLIAMFCFCTAAVTHAAAQTPQMGQAPATLFQSENRITLRFSFEGFTPVQKRTLRAAYISAYVRAVTCPYLSERYEDLRTTVLNTYENERTDFSAVGVNDDNPFECAYTHSGVFSAGHIRLRPMAFDIDSCGPLESTIFHEMLHTATPLTTTLRDVFRGEQREEQLVTSIERRCFPEQYTQRRGFHP